MSTEFYGKASEITKLESSITEDMVTDEIKMAVNTWIDLNIRRDGFTQSTADELYDIGRIDQTEIVLRHFPVISVESVTDLPFSSSPIVLDSSSYSIDNESGILTLITSQSGISSPECIARFSVGKKTTKVKYSYGFSSVPDDIKHIANMLAAKYIEMKMNQADANGLTQVKIGDYSESLDAGHKGIVGKYDTMFEPMVKMAKEKYATGY